MSLRTNQKGFTIVELLIVVVVIAILAAISIVAYTGITNRANTSASIETANSVKAVAVAYQGANGGYPTTKALFVSGGADPIAKLPSDIIFTPTTAFSGAVAAAAALTNPKAVIVYPCLTNGFRIFYKDYSAGTGVSMDAGDCTTAPGAAITPIV